MNWRGRTVEYSSGPAKRPLVEVSHADSRRCRRPLPDLYPGAVSVREEGSVVQTAWGWPITTPSFLYVRRETEVKGYFRRLQYSNVAAAPQSNMAKLPGSGTVVMTKLSNPAPTRGLASS